MTALAVDGKRRWNTAPRWRLCLFLNLTFTDFQIAGLIKFGGLETRIGYWQGITGYGVTGPEVVFGVSAFANTEQKFSVFSFDPAAHP